MILPSLWPQELLCALRGYHLQTGVATSVSGPLWAFVCKDCGAHLDGPREPE